MPPLMKIQLNFGKYVPKISDFLQRANKHLILGGLCVWIRLYLEGLVSFKSSSVQIYNVSDNCPVWITDNNMTNAMFPMSFKLCGTKNGWIWKYGHSLPGFCILKHQTYIQDLWAPKYVHLRYLLWWMMIVFCHMAWHRVTECNIIRIQIN